MGAGARYGRRLAHPEGAVRGGAPGGAWTGPATLDRHSAAAAAAPETFDLALLRQPTEGYASSSQFTSQGRDRGPTRLRAEHIHGFVSRIGARWRCGENR